MRKTIPYGKQELTQNDIDAVISVLKSDFWTQGPEIEKFEAAFASYVKSKYAVAVSNGTAALHLCAIALNIKPGDKVITSPITFVATANCVKYCGGEIVFADIDRETYLLDIKEVRKALEADTQKKIKGIIPVNFAGRVIDMEAFRKLADEFNCWIIEDACHSPGGSFLNSNGNKIMAGCGKYSELSIFSFHPVKHIAAGEGGMITTNNVELYKRLLILRSHGINKDSKKLAYKDSPWYYEMQELGYNYRLTDIQAALGHSQLKRAHLGLRKRQKIANRYKNSFKCISQITDRNDEFLYHTAYHLYIIEIENRNELYKYLKEQDVQTQIHYIPSHLMPYYKQFGWKEGDFPNSEDYYKKCLSLPIYPSLSKIDQSKVINLIIQSFE